jgi:type IV fimbrial biogenesis protein FimT
VLAANKSGTFKFGASMTTGRGCLEEIQATQYCIIGKNTNWPANYRSAQFSHGFTLIELAITLLIVSILALMAAPAFSTWTGNAKVRSVAETLQNGLRAAQTEALRRSRQTAFVLTNSTPAANAAAISSGTATNWYIQVLPLASETVNNPVVQSGSFGNATSGVTITSSDGNSTSHPVLCFNSMGRLVANATTVFGNSGCTVPTGAATYDLTNARADRTLEVQVQLGGQVRLCDKSRTIANSPDGC